MDSQQFLVEFGHIANAPGGISQLRRMIYQLAVTGRLTPRVNSDTKVAELLKAAHSRRQTLLRKKTSKRTLRLEGDPLVRPADVELPSEWRWSRLLDVGEINPRNDLRDDEEAAFVPMSAVPQEHGGRILAETKRWGDIKNGFTHFANGDVVLAKITPCFENGKAAVVSDLPVLSGAGAGTTELLVFRPFHEGIVPGYIYLFLRSPLFVAEGEQSMTGTAGQKRLPSGYFATRALPLPPTEEQSRIVAKVDELMALCAKLEAQQKDRRRLQNGLRHSSLQAVAAAVGTRQLRSAWNCLDANFARLFSAPADVRLLRDLMFDLTLRGRLVGEASLLGAADSALDESTSLPGGWKWRTLGDLSEYITSGARSWKAFMTSTGDAFIRSQDIRHDALIFENPAYVSLPSTLRGTRTQVRVGDLLLTITGGNVGKCAIVPQLSRDAYVSQHVALIRLRDKGFSELIHFWMVNSFGGRAFLAQFIYGDKPGLNLLQVGKVTVPIPPDELVPRVLARLRTYRETCDLLEQQLKSSNELASKLAVSAVSSLIGFATEQERDKLVKTTETELIAPLRLRQPPDVTVQAPLATLLARHRGEMGARDLWQRFGGDIDAFYAQLKAEVAHGWIQPPNVAEVREKNAV